MPRTLAFAPPQSLARKLNLLGEQIRLARQRRHLTMAMVSERAGITRVTLSKIEQGSPNVTMGAYANVLFALGLSDNITLLARDDVVGRALQDADLGTRVVPSRRRSKSTTHAPKLAVPHGSGAA